MRFRTRHKRPGIMLGLIFAGLALLTAAGCGASTKASKTDAGASGAGSDSSGTGHIDAMCIGDRINEPAEAFHYSYKYADASEWDDAEADVTPQNIDGTVRDKAGAHSLHAVRSNQNSWDGAVLALAQLHITVMSARLEALNGTSVLGTQGAGKTNGYQATKYSIDTAGANSSDKNTFETFFGKGSFEKGAIWMGRDGCVVKLVLDEGVYQPNGSIAKQHFEMDRSKK